MLAITHMKAMILGATGLLGQALMREWSGADVSGYGVKDLDIRDARKVREAVAGTQPEWVVLAAAYTDVDGCESNPERAFAVNRDGAVHVARAAKETGAKLLFLSSDYVFDGQSTSPYETSDARNPKSVYGRSKAEAEVRLLDILPGCCIVRTAWLFGTGGKCFPDTILKLAATRPTTGIVHVTNAGDCTWFELAREIVKSEGLPTEVKPARTGQMARPAPRPAYSVLSAKSLQQHEIVMPTWHDALGRYLRERRATR